MSDATFDFSDATVLVTGAARGIGAGIATRFREAGARVVVGYVTSEVDATALAGAIGARAIRADMSDRRDVEALFEAAGPIDVVINNAGIYPLRAFAEISDGEWRAMLDANLTSVFVTTQVAAQRMIARRSPGAIVNITSVEATHPGKLHAHYSAAKAGVAMLTRASALELAPHGIRVNAVAPGLIDHPDLAALWPDGVRRWLDRTPLARLGTKADVANACLFLASPAASFITGVSLPVDGGITATPAF
jgi:NAD(P)-dependent dehydrogenase (short-subunit alcohol dehydrogenase family)